MLTSTKSGTPEKDRNASVSAAEVIGRIVQHRILPFAVESVKKVARSRLKLFNADR